MLTILLICLIIVGLAVLTLNQTLQQVVKVLERLEDMDMRLGTIVEHCLQKDSNKLDKL